MEGSRFDADAGPEQVRIYSDTGRSDAEGNPVTIDGMTMRMPDQGDVDQLLREHGWRRIRRGCAPTTSRTATASRWSSLPHRCGRSTHTRSGVVGDGPLRRHVRAR